MRGVTYGTFRPDEHGNEHRYPRVERDFTQIAASGFNTVRTYTVPPWWLLDAAARHGLRVLIGLPWEQHVAFLDEPARARAIEDRVRAGVAACAGHPAVLGYTIGNEIPAPIVRWHGRRAIEGHLERLYRAARAEDPQGLVTYVNYPTTEYLDLPFLDLCAFNVYLESRERLDAYLARLHSLAGDRPVLLAEVGLDSKRNGLDGQAHGLGWQVRSAFASGCAGLFLFAWTDEWHRGGHDVLDWHFGLTASDRRPKPALRTVRRAMAQAPFPRRGAWPKVSVIVCSYNGARTIRQCLENLERLDYPSYEVIVVDDGSRDATPEIAREFDVRLISTTNHGLSSARNTGLRAATGDLVAYIDDDAYPDPHWLRYLVATFQSSSHVAVGGPNVPPPDEGEVAACVANAPGGPVHVLLSDREAEHIPGCNMAFRREALLAVGGFDPRFRTAGDDVDVCWRLQERGGTLGFHPAALVWHRRRSSVRAYFRQQKGYGRAEAMLERKWPEKYNRAGHLDWAGRLYGPGVVQALGWRKDRVYQGTWGLAPFQRLYAARPGGLAALPLMPESYLLLLALGALSALGLFWSPLLLAVPFLVLGAGITVFQAALSARQARFAVPARTRWEDTRRRARVALLSLMQPVARLTGRLQHGLSPWRRHVTGSLAWPGPRTFTVWREQSREVAATLQAATAALRAAGATVRAGGDFDPWDLEVSLGALGSVRVLMAIEEHGMGRQLLRFRAWSSPSRGWTLAALAVLGLAAVAGAGGALPAALALGGVAGALVAQGFLTCAAAMDLVRRLAPAAAPAEAVEPGVDTVEDEGRPLARPEVAEVA